MSNFTTLNTAVSGLRAAQAGLYVTGHNMSNSTVDGYVRQRVDQVEFMYNNIGYNGVGLLQRGLGTDIAQIQQIRDKYIDITYRQELSKANFYSVKATTGMDIQTIIGELQSAYNFQSVFQDVWNALNELNVYQPGLETRANFISTAITFVDKVNNVSERLYELQKNLDLQIRDAVTEVNKLITKIKTLNDRIVDAEVAGDHANDYRDERNRALDALSEYMKIEYKELPGGRVDIFCEGKMLLVCNEPNYLSLKYTSGTNSFVEPVFTGKASATILPYDAPKSSYYTLYDLTGAVSSLKGNDSGLIKGLMVSRGYYPATYATDPVTTNYGPQIDVLPDPSTYPGYDPTDPAHTAYDALYSAYVTDYNAWLAEYNAYLNNTGDIASYAGAFGNPPKAPDPSAYGLAPPPSGLDTDYEVRLNNYVGYDYAVYEAQYDNYKDNYLPMFKTFSQLNMQYKKDVFNETQCMIPKIQKEIDTIVHAVVTMINDALSPYVTDPNDPNYMQKDPDAPYGLDPDGSQYAEVFIRKTSPYSGRFDATDEYIAEDPNNYYSLYTMGNIMVNPELLNTDGYNMLALMPNLVDIEDTSIVEGLMTQWKNTLITFGDGEAMSVDAAYTQFVTQLGNDTQEALSFSQEQATLIAQIENKRQAVSGVSLDEEMTFMLTYQHAYNASARMVNQIDDMLDRIINKTGRVGL